MRLFSTEFILRAEVDRAVFLAETRAWVGGMKRTDLFGKNCQETIDGDNARWVAPSGESLMLRALSDKSGLIAVGCRHDSPAPDGLHWRTEAVMRRGARGNLLRVRAQCLSTRPLAVPETPKRTHLIRSLIENGRLADDGPLAVKCAAHRLDAGQESLDLAVAIALGTAGNMLPVVYCSVADDGFPVAVDRDLNRLAMNLCGIAHVVVEPSRKFSFELRDRTDGRNVYGGTIGIALPNQGFMRRLFLGVSLPDTTQLIEAVREASSSLRTSMPSQGGWEWHDLQDAILGDQRLREKGRLSAQENEAIWQEELKTKEERVTELESEIKALKKAAQAAPTEEVLALPGLALPEIWSGEFSDRLSAALQFCVEKGEDSGWDDRSLAIFRAWLDLPSPPSELEEFRHELKGAARDGNRFNAAMKGLLARYGFADKSDNKHSRMEPQPNFPGLQSITITKTPGNRRGLENFVAQVEANLGVTRLKQSR